MLTTLQYKLLRALQPGEPTHMSGAVYVGRSKLRLLLGDALLEQVRGRTVIDFGCGEGAEAIELAAHAARVFGLDIQEELLARARAAAVAAGVAERCAFGRVAPPGADVIVAIDSFEHFGDPAAVLRQMHELLRPGGEVITSFGPTWYHPYGGHLFSIFPWAHLVFTERALLRWRSHIRSDGATRFAEVAGGLNQMSIRRFERLVAASPFQLASLELVPIRKLRRVHGRLTREFTTSIVRCRLRKRGAADDAARAPVPAAAARATTSDPSSTRSASP